MAFTTFTANTDAIASEVNDNFDIAEGKLSEVRMFALSITGAVTKATLQGQGWAICDGTTPAAQGISSAAITSTPNLENKFMRASDDEASGATGGSDTNTHTHTATPNTEADQFNAGATYEPAADTQFTTDGPNDSENRPAFYEVVLFIKVKLINS